MGDGYEPYHVPQQSRRDKLRVINNNNPILFPTPPPNFYDHHHPLLIPPDLIPPSFNPSPIKEEGSTNLFLPSLMYPHQPLSNPTTTHDIYNNNNNNTYRTVLHDQSFQGHGKHVMTTTTGQSLSLSLSSHPLELNLQQQQQRSYGETPSGIAGFHGVELSRSSVPLGPFTGYASVLNGSRFLKPAQQLLEEICEVGCVYGAAAVDSGLLDPDPVENLSSQHDEALSCSSSIDVGEQTRKKSGLLSMLEEVYKRYKMYYQQVQAVIASFESVAGLSNAAPFANLALKALTKHFRRLKYAITDQLQFATKSHGKMSYERDESQRVENWGKAPYAIRSFQSTGLVDQPVWRPQRGLPERAVTLLRAWLFEHFLHPYPTDSDKLMLAKQTGLTRNQVSNWFINARVRLWKPMVEEIHTLETRQNQKNSQRDEPPPPNRPNDQMPSSSSFDQCENASTSIQRMADFSLKRNREDLAMGPTNLPYENLSHHPHLGGGVGGSGGVSNVSLTLGLHQNGVALHEAYPLNAARRFGLDSHGDGYVMTGFPTQNRPFGRDIIG